jgi:cyclopropane-fatty-acyl-phospholipid synthase
MAIMLEKTIISAMLKRLRVGGVRVIDWTGGDVNYGPDKPYLTLHIHHPRAVRAIVRNLTLGFGESYMNGDIDIDGDIRGLGKLISENQAAFSHRTLGRLPHVGRRNTRSRQRKFVAHHYDLGNDFYKLWLDETMTYSCAYYHSPTDTLEAAQAQKLDYTLKKLQLKPGMALLDIGSGWGQLLIAAVQTYGVTGHGITLSQEQYELSREKVERLGLEDKITFELVNYQDLAERDIRFDRIISVGMYEHVGRGNHRDYFSAVDKLLKPGGITLLHTITNELETKSDPWIDKYIFPGGYIPSVRETIHLMPEYNMRLQDYENLRLHYALTLDEWLKRYDENSSTIIAKYGDGFYRMWRLYLAGSITGFRYDNLNLSQFVMTKGLVNDGPITRDFLYR